METQKFLIELPSPTLRRAPGIPDEDDGVDPDNGLPDRVHAEAIERRYRQIMALFERVVDYRKMYGDDYIAKYGSNHARDGWNELSSMRQLVNLMSQFRQEDGETNLY